MLWHPQDAEDATQEILIRVVTRLAQFDFKSRLRTWAYRVATNYLLDVKKSCVERQKPNFTSFAEDLAEGLSPDGPADHERSVLTEEVKIGCTLGMLQCLDRPHRLAYVLGEILDLPAPEAADALDLEPAAFRKRLQRAREAIEAFTRSHCGLVSDAAACACNRRVPAAVQLGRLQPNELHFAEAGSSFAEARELIRGIDEAKRVIELHRNTHSRNSALDFTQLVVSALDSAHG
jgi:RNA polymerase sigma factor (sigma-70 family)